MNIHKIEIIGFFEPGDVGAIEAVFESIASDLRAGATSGESDYNGALWMVTKA